MSQKKSQKAFATCKSILLIQIDGIFVVNLLTGLYSTPDWLFIQTEFPTVDIVIPAIIGMFHDCLIINTSLSLSLLHTYICIYFFNCLVAQALVWHFSWYKVMYFYFYFLLFFLFFFCMDLPWKITMVKIHSNFIGFRGATLNFCHLNQKEVRIFCLSVELLKMNNFLLFEDTRL